MKKSVLWVYLPIGFQQLHFFKKADFYIVKEHQ